METPAKTQSVALRCPTCDDIGKPLDSTTKGASTLTKLRCPSCQRDWTHVYLRAVPRARA